MWLYIITWIFQLPVVGSMAEMVSIHPLTMTDPLTLSHRHPWLQQAPGSTTGSVRGPTPPRGVVDTLPGQRILAAGVSELSQLRIRVAICARLAGFGRYHRLLRRPIHPDLGVAERRIRAQAMVGEVQMQMTFVGRADTCTCTAASSPSPSS